MIADACNMFTWSLSHDLQGLSRGLSSLAGAGRLHEAVGRLAALALILEALQAGEQQLARQLHQCATVGLQPCCVRPVDRQGKCPAPYTLSPC